MGDFWGLGGYFWSFGNLALGRDFWEVFVVATRNLLLKRLVFEIFGRGRGNWGFCVYPLQSMLKSWRLIYGFGVVGYFWGFRALGFGWIF